MENKRYLISDINTGEDSDDIEMKQNADKYNIVAQATTFGDRDRQEDIIDKNAFNASLKRIANGERLKILLQHKGDMPLGNWLKAIKNDKGIKLYGVISEATQHHKEILQLIREKVYDKVSVGFIIKQAESIANGGLLIKQAEMVECSVVSVPANINANILSVKSYNEMLNFIDEEEEERRRLKAYNNIKRELKELIAKSYRIGI